MLWLDSAFDCPLRSQTDRQPPAWRWLKALCRFSQFYGSYQSLPPRQRRQFVIENDAYALSKQPMAPANPLGHLAPAHRFQIEQRCDRSGRTFFQVVDCVSKERLTFYSETNLNLWLQQRLPTSEH